MITARRRRTGIIVWGCAGSHNATVPALFVLTSRPQGPGRDLPSSNGGSRPPCYSLSYETWSAGHRSTVKEALTRSTHRPSGPAGAGPAGADGAASRCFFRLVRPLDATAERTWVPFPTGPAVIFSARTIWGVVLRLVALVSDVVEHHIYGPTDDDLAFNPGHAAPVRASYHQNGLWARHTGPPDPPRPGPPVSSPCRATASPQKLPSATCASRRSCAPRRQPRLRGDPGPAPREQDGLPVTSQAAGPGSP